MIPSLGATILGLGIAPLLIGISNDLLMPSLGDGAIPYSLLATPIFLALCALSALLATISVREDFDRLHGSGQE